MFGSCSQTTETLEKQPLVETIGISKAMFELHEGCLIDTSQFKHNEYVLEDLGDCYSSYREIRLNDSLLGFDTSDCGDYGGAIVTFLKVNESPLILKSVGVSRYNNSYVRTVEIINLIDSVILRNTDTISNPSHLETNTVFEQERITPELAQKLMTNSNTTR